MTSKHKKTALTAGAATMLFAGCLVTAPAYAFNQFTGFNGAVNAPGNPMEHFRPFFPGPPRSAQDFGFLKDPAKRTDPFDPIRYVPLGDSSYVSFGGGIRADWSYDDNKFGAAPPVGDDGGDNYFETRVGVHADLHLFNDAIRFFGQIQNTHSWDNRYTAFAPVAGSGTEFTELFTDINIPLAIEGKTFLRFGRQEMSLGSGVLTTTRLVPNVLLSWDGFRLHYNNKAGYAMDAFTLREVRPDSGPGVSRASFDDQSSSDYRLSGLYVTVPWSNDFGSGQYFAEDFYYFHSKQEAVEKLANDERSTFGTRFFGYYGNLDFTAELMYQIGNTELGGSPQDIQAWGFYSNTGYTFNNVAMKPGVALSLDAASGDDGSTNGKNETFNPLWGSHGKFYGNTGGIRLSNLVSVGPVFQFSPLENITVSAYAKKMWRESGDDDVYAAPGIPYGITNTDKDIGVMYDISVNYAATDNLTLQLEYSQLHAGDALDNAGIDSPKYASARVYFLF